ncbi:MAG: response regulator [Terriglobales bacterium]
MRCPVVLCVDDAEEILSFYQNLLGNYGYAVMVAAGGVAALELFQPTVSPIDAVILDFQMPGVTGLELAISLKRLDPELPVVMVAGSCPRLEEMSPFVDSVIPKGTSMRMIADRIELLLEAARPAGN